MSKKLDVFNHVLPAAYVEAARKKASKPLPFDFQVKKFPALIDVDARFRMMDADPDLRQILSMANPPLEGLFEPKDAVELYRIGNDALAELVAKHPDRFEHQAGRPHRGPSPTRAWPGCWREPCRRWYRRPSAPTALAGTRPSGG